MLTCFFFRFLRISRIKTIGDRETPSGCWNNIKIINTTVTQESLLYVLCFWAVPVQATILVRSWSLSVWWGRRENAENLRCSAKGGEGDIPAGLPQNLSSFVLPCREGTIALTLKLSIHYFEPHRTYDNKMCLIDIEQNAQR